MPQISYSAGMSVGSLEAAIQLLRMKERKWRKAGRKRALYRYLETVFGLYTAWKEDDVARYAANRIAKLSGLRTQPKRHPIRAIIDATSGTDRRSKSRWTRALRFAWRERKQWNSLSGCLRANGGIAGAATKWADLRSEMQTPAGCVRIGGEDRVPKIPFFVDIELLDAAGRYKVEV